MKKNLLLVFIIACFSTSQLNAQALWGAEAMTGQGDGQFDTGFTQTTNSNNLATTGWTAITVFDTSGNNIPGNAYWVRSIVGYSQGAYWGGTNPISSPSHANGVAILDSDFMDNDGVAGAFGTGIAPSAQRAELVSPPIDLTGYTDELIMLKLYSFYRGFIINELSIAASTDNGLSWGDAVDYRVYQPELTEGFIYVPFPADTLAGLANLTQVRIKFTFEGDYYFAIVDDVTLMINDVIFTNGFEN